MPLLHAYVLPHPPLAVPGVGRGQEAGIAATLAAYDEAAREIAALAPDAIVFITPHGTVYADYFHISPGHGAQGDLSRFGAGSVRFEAVYDAGLIREIIRLAKASGVYAGTQGAREASLDHGVTVPMWFINRRYAEYKAVRISQSGMDAAEHYRLGAVIRKAAEASGRKTILVASADLSHKLSAEGPYGFAPEGFAFDAAVTEALSSGDFLSLFAITEEQRDRAAECGYNSCLVLAGCFDGLKVQARLLSYEGPFGVGYAVAGFAPGEPDAGRRFLERHTRLCLEEALARRNTEDAYRALARASLEHTVLNGTALLLPEGLPGELLNNRAGVFVSLHMNGRLRGCVGTIGPVTGCVALEIIRNAVSAGREDTRFDPVTASELPLLTYKVDVLAAPEPISGPGELDVKRYGVIVTSAGKCGLLLPNLDGIDTPEEQIAIAMRKAGIAPNAAVRLERFEVTRHE
jgi:AmmeMemoRadiSam system protein A